MLHLEKLQQDWNYGNNEGPVFNLYRAKIPGGWLVLMGNWGNEQGSWGYGGTTFVPDPRHEWDGSSLP